MINSRINFFLFFFFSALPLPKKNKCVHTHTHTRRERVVNEKISFVKDEGERSALIRINKMKKKKNVDQWRCSSFLGCSSSSSSSLCVCSLTKLGILIYSASAHTQDRINTFRAPLPPSLSLIFHPFLFWVEERGWCQWVGGWVFSSPFLLLRKESPRVFVGGVRWVGGWEDEGGGSRSISFFSALVCVSFSHFSLDSLSFHPFSCFFSFPFFFRHHHHRMENGYTSQFSLSSFSWPEGENLKNINKIFLFL
jgi:hypothetical protein